MINYLEIDESKINHHHLVYSRCQKHFNHSNEWKWYNKPTNNGPHFTV